jgi:hypothetical protein
MHITAILLAALMADLPETEPAHVKNDVFSYVLEQGLEVDGTKITLQKPRFFDGQDGATQKAILIKLAQSTAQLEQMMDHAEGAPNYLAKDEIQVKPTSPHSPIVRVVDVCFVVYADLKQFDPESQMARLDGQKGDSNGIKFEMHLLKDTDVRAAGITLGPEPAGQKTWFTEVLGELPKRVKFKATQRAVATQSPGSVVIATRTEPAFAKGRHPSNVWRQARNGSGASGGEITGPYEGGITYAKASRVAFRPGALIVELRAAWVEPFEWYEGAGPLAGKLKGAAQGLIKNMRRQLDEKRPE